MKRLFRIIACSACALGTLALLGSSTHGTAGSRGVSELQSDLAVIRSENEARQQRIDSLGGNISDNKTAIRLLGSQIDGYMKEIAVFRRLVAAKQTAVDEKLAEIGKIESTISRHENLIKNTKTQIAELEVQNKKSLEKFGEIARYMYMNNFLSQNPMLNNADDWFEYFVFSRVAANVNRQSSDFVEEINAEIERQGLLLAELNAELSLLENEKTALQNEKATYEAQKSDLENEKSNLERELSEKLDKIYILANKNDELFSKIAGLKTQIREANAQADAINEEIKELIRQAQQNRDPDMPDYSGEGLMWPLDRVHNAVSTYYGYDEWRDDDHLGIDISDKDIKGAPIYAAQSGRVITASVTCTHNEAKMGWTCGCGGNYGNFILIDHGGSLSTLYGHCQAVYVNTGQYVEKGEVIGEVGSTGWSTWWHLHFEVREDGERVDPMQYFG